jgi:hypothetical protein
MECDSVCGRDARYCHDVGPIIASGAGSAIG